MKLETLYTLDSNNKVRVFECEVRYGMYNDPHNPNPLLINSVHRDSCSVITKTGLLGGKLITKEELVKSGKQNRTVQEQAEFQANSLWNEKLNEGYKQEVTLVTKLISMGVDTPVDIRALISHANHHIPHWSYTNNNWDELPMLAKKFKDIKNPEFPYYVQPKLNGVRCLVKNRIFKDPTLYGVKLCSRGGQYYQITHLEIALSEILNKFQTLYGLEIILDGEIYKHGIPLQDISGAARTEDEGMFQSNGWLEYHIYDVIDLNLAKQEDRLVRLGYISEIIKRNEFPFIKVVKTNLVSSQEGIKFYHNQAIQEGYEGLILRHPKGKYEFNQRSKNLLKVKEYQDEEFKIIGCDYDPNKSLGESFVFLLQNNINLLIFEARPTGTIKQKEDWYNNQSWIDKMATVRFFERSKDGLPLQACVRSKDSKVLIEHIRPYGE